MKGVLLKPGTPPHVVEVDEGLEALQGVIGGYIETLYLGESAVCLFDEEGLIKGLQPCGIVEDFRGVERFLRGPLLFLGQGDGDFVDVPEWVISKYCG